MGHSVDELFDYLMESSQSGAVLLNWRGELYLEVCCTCLLSSGLRKKTMPMMDRLCVVPLWDVHFTWLDQERKLPLGDSGDVEVCWRFLCMASLSS
jgi:hypothetical protein